MESSLATYTELAYAASWRLTQAYSTSFSLGIRIFSQDIRPHIAAIYGMVRVADEIVDSWHDLDQSIELDRFEAECYLAISAKYSSNLILHSFALTFNKFGIDRSLVEAFFVSMRMDLAHRNYDRAGYDEYIYGSAEVIGLMCLSVFVAGDKREYKRLEHGARALGSAFQKVNFLRDIGTDNTELGRYYFPGIGSHNMTEADMRLIIAEIEADFAAAAIAIKELPLGSRRGVALAWRYYAELLAKVKNTPISELYVRRIRVGDARKAWLFARSFVPLRSIV